MAKFIYALNVSLDGYVDHDTPGMVPDADLFRHFIDDVAATRQCIYGTRMYRIMRYWDGAERDQHDGGQPDLADYTAAWRAMHKWVVSSSLAEVGPNATLVTGDLVPFARRLKAEEQGDIEVAGTRIAQSLTEAGLIDEYRLYLHPVVAGGGTRYFAGAAPRLRLTASKRIGGDVIRLTYVPA